MCLKPRDSINGRHTDNEIIIILIKNNMKNLVNKIVQITSDNENYIDWIDRKLSITYASNSGNGYDSAMYPEMLCDLADANTGEHFPFALYEYEFEVIN